MASLPKQRLTPEQYLAFERTAEHRSEYISGEMLAMAGNTREHVLIVTNLVVALATALRGRPCETYSTEMRVRASETAFTYPDVVVMCGDPQFAGDQFDTLTNPSVIFEVLSKSTEAYDRGEKFALYRSLSSLKQYVLVAQERPHVEWFIRQPDGHWMLHEASGSESEIDLPAIGCQVDLSQVYDRVSFAESESSA